MLSSRDLRALGYKKYALCELSNEKRTTSDDVQKKTSERRRSRDYRPTEKTVTVPYGTGSSFARRCWRAWLPIQTGHMVRQRSAMWRKEGTKKGEWKWRGCVIQRESDSPTLAGFDKFRILSWVFIDSFWFTRSTYRHTRSTWTNLSRKWNIMFRI